MLVIWYLKNSFHLTIEIRIFYNEWFFVYKLKFISVEKKRFSFLKVMTQKSKLWQTIAISLSLRIALIVIISMYENVERG